MFNSVYLSNIRARAIRRRVLYKALDGLERGILYLASRVVDDVRSSVLIKQLVLIVKKLDTAMRSGFMRHVETYGVEQARRIVKTAKILGSYLAEEWLDCAGFLRYLAFMDVNR